MSEGRCSAWAAAGYIPNKIMSGELENPGQRGQSGMGGSEIMDRVRGRGSSGVWHHGGLEYRRTVNSPRGMVQHNTVYAKGVVGHYQVAHVAGYNITQFMPKGLQNTVYGRMEEGRLILPQKTGRGGQG